MRHTLRRVFVFLVAGALAASQAAHASAEPRQGEALGRAVESAVQGKATGTILVARHGKVLLVRSFGDARQSGFRPSRSTSYDLASIGKTFTAILALRLVDDGRFDMDAPLRRYLPELPEEMSDITARNALSHTAGLPRYFEGGDDLVMRTRAQALGEIAAMKRERKVGEYYYSNLGPALVALALERAGGDSYPNLVRRLIFRPAGMRDAYFHGDAGSRRSAAPAYADGQRKGSPAEWPQTWTMLGAAGIAASVDDLLRLNRAVFVGHLLSDRSRSELLADGISTGGRASFKTADTLDIHYGNGLFHWRDRKGRHVHFHGGASDFGSNTGMLWRQDDDLFIACLLNSTTGAFTREEFYTAVLNALD